MTIADLLAALTLSLSAPTHGERLPPEALGPGVIEEWSLSVERDLHLPADWDPNPRDREDAPGEWLVPPLAAMGAAHSGAKHVTNRWGDVRMGIAFPHALRVDGAWIGGMSDPAVWSPAIRALGFREGQLIATTGWFRDLTLEPRWFPIHFAGVDRIVIEAEPIIGGAAWYALDDLTLTGLTAPDAQTVLDFESLPHGRALTEGRYGGLTWETGSGFFTADESVHAPLDPTENEEEENDAPQNGAALGGLAINDSATLPVLQSQFTGVVRGDAGSFSYPPDTAGAIGPSHFVVTVNRVIAIYNRSTGALVSQSTLGSFLPGSNGDPRIAYDQHSGRWIVIVSDFSSRVYLAVSTTNNPTGSWFKTNIVVSSGSDAGRWPDYPTLGISAQGIFTAAYMVGSPAQMSLFVINKAPLIAGSPSLGTVTAFRDLPWEGAMQPAHVFGNPGVQYIVSRGDANEINVRIVDGPIGNPDLSDPVPVPVPPHDNPPDADALESSVPLDTVGTRLMNAVYRNGSLWTAHTVGIDGRAACQWYELDADALTLLQQGTIHDPVRHYFFPTLSVNAQGSVLIGFSGSSPSQYAAAYWSGRRANDPIGHMAPPALLVPGAGSQNNIDGVGRNRWGDYSLTTIDPLDDLTLWTIQEFAFATDLWGTRIGSHTVALGPVNDFCIQSTTASDGDTPFSTVGAAQDGPTESPVCGAPGNDVWFKYNVECTGDLTLSTCGASFNTALAIYDGCPNAGAALLGCNDDSCGTGSSVTIPVTSGMGLRIRISGGNGSGTLSVHCEPGSACPADVDSDGSVGFSDVLAVLAAWSSAGGRADADGDGIVGFGDVLFVLSAWGACP